MALNYQELSDFQLASLIRTGTSNALCGASHELGRRAERDAIQKYLPGLLCDYLSHLDGRRLEVVHALGTCSAGPEIQKAYPMTEPDSSDLAMTESNSNPHD